MAPRAPLPPAVLAGAAATLAAVPGATRANVAAAVGVSQHRLNRDLNENPAVSTDPIRTREAKAAEVTALAHEAVNRAQTALSGPDLPPVAAVAERVAGSLAVDVSAKVLERHRKEWEVPRGLLAEAVKTRDFERAKLAKISAETLTLVQQGERTAHGIKAGEIAPLIEVERD